MLTVEESQVILLSLRVAFACVFVTIPPALVLGWVLARCDFPFKLLIDGICHLPLVMPPVVVGYLLLIAFGRQACGKTTSQRLVNKRPKREAVAESMRQFFH